MASQPMHLTVSPHHRRLIARVGAGLLLMLLLCAPAAVAQAAPPANDNFANAVIVQLPGQVTGTIDDATLEAGEPDPSDGDGATSVWYRYTPATQQRVKLDTCASTFYARVTVYTGSSVASLTEVTHSQGGCEGGGRAYFTAAAGTTYHIAVNGYVDDSGVISLAISVPQPPANDDFDDAEDIQLPDQVTGTVDDATLEPGEPDPTEEGGSVSVWYRYTAASGGRVKLDTCDSTLYARTTVYTGSDVAHLTTIARHEGYCDGGGRAYFTASASTTYRIQITTYVGQSGTIALTASVPQPPPNDDFAAARALGMPELVAGTNVDATLEAGEPDPFDDGTGHSVWYRLTLNTTQSVGVDTCDSDFDTVLGVYTGASLASLTEVGFDDDSCDYGSIVDFVSSPGTTYYIQVRGYESAMGTFKLLAGGAHASPQPPPPPPPPPGCPPSGSAAGAVAYAGAHSGGGSVCLTVLPGFNAVASFQALNAPGDICHFGGVLDRFAPAVPIVNRAFSAVLDSVSGSFPTDRGAQGTFRLTRTTGGGLCSSPVLSWTASTTATPPWAVPAPPVAPPPPAAPPADRTPPTLRLRGATIQRPLRTNHLVVTAQCRHEACVAKATATVARVKLASRNTAVRRGASRTLTLTLTRRARRALGVSLRSGRRVRVRVLVVARDAAGNRTSARRTLTLRR